MATRKKTEEASSEATVRSSDEIWNKVKNVQVNLFGLEDETVDRYSTRILEELDDRVYLMSKAPALVSVLEEILRTLNKNNNKPITLSTERQYIVLSYE